MLDKIVKIVEIMKETAHLITKNQSMWNTSGKGMDTGELSGFTSMISAI